ncbi:MAG: hypothetical protein ABIP77_09760 [Candidatus Limnocylindrales bacterium]
MHFRTLAGVIFFAVTALACSGSPSSAPTSPLPTAIVVYDPAEVSTAVAAFVSALQDGDGAIACPYLRDDEQQLFLTNAKAIARFREAATSCQDLVAAFPAIVGSRVSDLDGKFAQVTVLETIATGSWVFGSGEQHAILRRGDDGWQFIYDSNDFPSALLHFDE